MREPEDELDRLLDVLDAAVEVKVAERNTRTLDEIAALLAATGRAPADKTPEALLAAIRALVLEAGLNNQKFVGIGTAGGGSGGGGGGFGGAAGGSFPASPTTMPYTSGGFVTSTGTAIDTRKLGADAAAWRYNTALFVNTSRTQNFASLNIT